MPATLEPIRRFKCTYPNCPASFDTEKEMKRHKRDNADHDYCYKCDEDFDSFDDLAQHMAFRPLEHDKACRVCGEEFKSKSGLIRHIELNHKIDQKLPCLGCGEEFYRASLMVEHLEFGHCKVISQQQFMGHIVHKHLVTELLKGGAAYDRFMQKISKYDAAQDYEEEGGVGLEDILEQEEDESCEVEFEAIPPEIEKEDQVYQGGPYPPLPSQTPNWSNASDVTSTLGRISLGGGDESATARGSTSGVAEGSSKTATSSGQLKPWTGTSSKELFPHAKPTPVSSEFSISYHDEQMEQEHGINIMNTRFWDPLSGDWNPERFFDGVIQQYYCPFVCEQTFENATKMNRHILQEHRITRMKCPSCLKYFKSVTALMSHCESRGSKCQINKAEDFNIFLDKLTGGFLSVEEKTRPDHIHNPTVLIQNQETGRVEPYTPPTANYLQYATTKPADWKEPKKVAAQIGGGNTSGTFKYQGEQSHW